ncbi:hypothetical protein, partial [Pseudomonas atacamensis]|uniref:hypothetical protein n=1 Tax=Pseudomonas atacamensis TaxID=2565368 RepID=UPI002B1D5DC8
ISSADPTNELLLDAAEGVKISCTNSSGKSLKINTSSSIILNYGSGYILHPNASLQMIKDDANSSFILYEKVPLLKTLQLNGSTENINAN